MCDQCRSGEDPIHWPKHQVNGGSADDRRAPNPPSPGARIVARLIVLLLLFAAVACAVGVAIRAAQWAWPG